MNGQFRWGGTNLGKHRLDKRDFRLHRRSRTDASGDEQNIERLFPGENLVEGCGYDDFFAPGIGAVVFLRCGCGERAGDDIEVHGCAEVPAA